MIKAHRNSETEGTWTESTHVCTRSFAYVCSFSLVVYETPECVKQCNSDSCAFSWDFFPSVDLVLLSSFHVMILHLSYSILLCGIWLSPRSLFYSNERNGVNSDGRRGGEELGGEELQSRYVLWKESHFNKRKTHNNNNNNKGQTKNTRKPIVEQYWFVLMSA